MARLSELEQHKAGNFRIRPFTTYQHPLNTQRVTTRSYVLQGECPACGENWPVGWSSDGQHVVRRYFECCNSGCDLKSWRQVEYKAIGPT